MCPSLSVLFFATFSKNDAKNHPKTGVRIAQLPMANQSIAVYFPAPQNMTFQTIGRQMEAFRLQIPFAKSDYFPDERTDGRTDARTDKLVLSAREYRALRAII